MHIVAPRCHVRHVMLALMADQQIPCSTRVLARLQAHADATRPTDPRYGDLEPLR